MHAFPVFDEQTLRWLQKDCNLLKYGYANTLHYYGAHTVCVRHLIVDNAPAINLPLEIGDALINAAKCFATMFKVAHVSSVEVHMQGTTVDGPIHVDYDEHTPVFNVVVPLNDLYNVSTGGCTALCDKCLNLCAGCNEAVWFDGSRPHRRTAASSAEFASLRRILIMTLTEKRFPWKALSTARRLHRVAMTKQEKCKADCGRVSAAVCQ